jgi:hypothetical protein
VSRRSWYAYYTKFDEADIKDVIDALTTKNRTVKGWEGKVSLSDLGYSAAGIDEGCVGLGSMHSHVYMRARVRVRVQTHFQNCVGVVWCTRMKCIVARRVTKFT